MTCTVMRASGCADSSRMFYRSVHVVFGLVISGFEVIKKIEGLKTDTASRPYADVRVIDCGQLITKSAKDGNLVSYTNVKKKND